MSILIDGTQNGTLAFDKMVSHTKLKSDEKMEKAELAATNMSGFDAFGENHERPDFNANFQSYFPLPYRSNGENGSYEFDIEMPFNLNSTNIPFSGKRSIEIIDTTEHMGVSAYHIKASTLINKLEIPKHMEQNQSYQINSQFEGYFDPNHGVFLSGEISIESKGNILMPSNPNIQPVIMEEFKIYSKEEVSYILKQT